MSRTLPAMRGQMGNLTYYLLSFKAGELVHLVQEPTDMPGWDDEKIEEIYQRKIKYNRVKSQIVPYLAKNKEGRFFGSIIVAAVNFEKNIRFTPMAKIPAVDESKLPDDYMEASDKIGMLTIAGSVMMVPLDGQHRLKALKFSISGKDEKDKDIPGIGTNPDIADEDISVILVPYEAEKARRIFTKVNRYAHPPTPAETYVTDDDDIYAVLARFVANKIGARLVKYNTTTLTAKDPHFTTLTILHQCCEEIIKYNTPTVLQPKLKRGEISDPELESHIESFKTIVWDHVWKRLLSPQGIEVFQELTKDPKTGHDELRMDIRKANLLGKPVTQGCLVSAYLMLTQKSTGMSWKKACENLNKLPWVIDSHNVTNIWQRVLWDGDVNGKIITKKRPLCNRLIAYMAGANLEEGAEGLLKDYLELFPEDERRNRDLPPRVVD